MEVEIRKHFPFQVLLEVSNNETCIDDWLVDNVGNYNHAWRVVYWPNLVTYYFKKAEDAVWFALTWT